jgi:hypothetical protein
MAFRKVVNGELRTEANSGFAAYIGSRRVAWSLDVQKTINAACAVISNSVAKKRFAPCAVIFDCARLLNLAFITDDGKGLTLHLGKHTSPEMIGQ